MNGDQIIAWVEGPRTPPLPGYRSTGHLGGIRLSPQESLILSALERSARPIDEDGLDRRIGGYDGRGPGIVKVLVSRLRAKLGRQVIGTERGAGYYITDYGRQRLAALRAAP